MKSSTCEIPIPLRAERKSNKMVSNIWSEEEAKQFFTRLLECNKQAYSEEKVAIVSALFSREKYLPDKWKFTNKRYNRTLECTLSRTVDECMHNLRRLDSVAATYRVGLKRNETTIEDTPLPKEAASVLTSINSPDVTAVNAEVTKSLMLGTFDHLELSARLPSLYFAHAAKNDVVLRDLDIDTKDPEVLKKIKGLLFGGEHCLSPVVLDIIETTNGYHVLYQHHLLGKERAHRLKEAFKAFVTMTVCKRSRDNKTYTDFLVSLNKSNQAPTPGTMQGSWKVRSIPIKEFL